MDFSLPRLLGLSLVLLVVFIWVASSFLTQNIYGDFPHPLPFFITYFNTASFAVYLLPNLIRWVAKKLAGEHAVDNWDAAGAGWAEKWAEWLSRARKENEEREAGDYAEIRDDNEDMGPEEDEISPNSVPMNPSPLPRGSLETVVVSPPPSPTSIFSEPANDETPSIWLLALRFAPLWFLANYASNLSLSLTSVSSATILSSTSGLFTLLLSSLIYRKRPHVAELLSVLLSLAGVVLVSLDDTRADSGSDSAPKHQRTLPGDILALSSAFFYALYSLLLARLPATVSPPVFLGHVGLLNTILFWPFFIPLTLSAFEPFPTHFRGSTIGQLFANALIGTATSDLLWVLAVLVTTPLIVTVGLSLTIPLAILGDFVIKGVQPSLWHLVGGGMVVAGFVGVNLGPKAFGLLRCCRRPKETGFGTIATENGGC